jgi:ABC-type sugar transport system ATPase subunit
MTNEPVLEMSLINKSFGSNKVLYDVDFDLIPGEVHILAGENGAGKSTLIKIISGIHTDYEGTIQLDNKPVKFRNSQEAAEMGISVIHQELSLIPSMNVIDNIFLGREKCRFGMWMDFQSEETACEELLNTLGLDLDIHRPVGSYPISVQQTIEIAGALAFDARIIIMDEPTSALSEPEVDRLFSIISDLKNSGHAIIYISHKMDEIYRIADRITVLRDGESIGTAKVEDLPRNKLVQWMVGREINEQFPRHAPHPGEERLRVENFTVPDPEGLKKPVVNNISFNLHAGEILGIGGLQGSGASELLNGLYGVYDRPPSGKVWLDGEPFGIESPKHSINRGMALLTNDRKTTGLVGNMSITNNITLASIPKYSPLTFLQKNRELETAKHYRDYLGIKSTNLSLSVNTLSGGNQQKVIFARWILNKPKVLLLDEPTRGVDVGAKREIYELMNRWTEEGYAILLITSEMPELLALSDRIIVMHRGEITAEFKGSEASQELVLKAAMGKQ